MHQRRLAGAGRPHHRRQLALVDVERDAAQGVDCGIAFAVAAGDVSGDDDCSVGAHAFHPSVSRTDVVGSTRYAERRVAEKRYLFTPGPTPVPPEVLAALAEPIVHHRTPDYRLIFGECLERLRAVCRTVNDVLLFTCSGTGAMESAVANLCSPGDRVVVVSAGAFGERWREAAALTVAT